MLYNSVSFFKGALNVTDSKNISIMRSSGHRLVDSGSLKSFVCFLSSSYLQKTP